eukprot:gene24405-10011_t
MAASHTSRQVDHAKPVQTGSHDEPLLGVLRNQRVGRGFGTQASMQVEALVPVMEIILRLRCTSVGLARAYSLLPALKHNFASSSSPRTSSEITRPRNLPKAQPASIWGQPQGLLRSSTTQLENHDKSTQFSPSSMGRPHSMLHTRHYHAWYSKSRDVDRKIQAMQTLGELEGLTAEMGENKCSAMSQNPNWQGGTTTTTATNTFRVAVNAALCAKIPTGKGLAQHQFVAFPSLWVALHAAPRAQITTGKGLAQHQFVAFPSLWVAINAALRAKIPTGKVPPENLASILMSMRRLEQDIPGDIIDKTAIDLAARYLIFSLHDVGIYRPPPATAAAPATASSAAAGLRSTGQQLWRSHWVQTSSDAAKADAECLRMLPPDFEATGNYLLLHQGGNYCPSPRYRCCTSNCFKFVAGLRSGGQQPRRPHWVQTSSDAAKAAAECLRMLPPDF